MFAQFTDRARKVMALANQEALRFSHEYIGTEHMLLGLIEEGTGVGVNVLKNLDVDLREVRDVVEAMFKAGPDPVHEGALPQTPRAKQVIAYALEEARDLGHNYVGTEHLLLGLLRVEEGVAAKALVQMGLSPEDVREEVYELLGAGLTHPAPDAEPAADSFQVAREVVITGASNETGPAVARAFAATGAAMVITYHSDRAAGEAVQKACLEAGAEAVTLLQLDLMDNIQCAELIGKADDAMGGIDALIEVAAASPNYTPLAEIDLEQFQRTIQGQITGNFLLARDAGNLMKQTGGGQIVLFGATSSLKYNHASYGFAKAAINELTKFLALEMAPEVTVNTIVPGMIDIAATDADLRTTRAANSPLRRIVTPQELGAMCVAMCSSVFATITGQTLIMDGGFFLKPVPDGQ